MDRVGSARPPHLHGFSQAPPTSRGLAPGTHGRAYLVPGRACGVQVARGQAAGTPEPE